MTQERTTQTTVEAIVQADDPELRATQATVEAIVQADDPELRVTQASIEAIVQAPLTSTTARVSRISGTVLRIGEPGVRFARVTQAVLKAARKQDPTLGLVTHAHVKVARHASVQPSPVLKSWMVFDPDGFFDVLMISGVPTSALDELAVLNGANAIAMGNEILQFRDATDLGDNVFRLSHLLRGRLETEQHMNNHDQNELVVFLDSESIRRTSDDINEIDTVKLWKAVGVGQTVNDVSATGFINTGTSLRPWAPVHIQGTRDGSGNLTITWFRRTRIQYEWLDSVDVALGEAIHEFQVEILSGSGAVVRTIVVLDSETAEYSAVDQTTDFGGTQDLVLVRIAQKSEQLGFGYNNTELL